MGPPQAVQKVRDNYYLVQVLVSESPSADWRRLFYETQQDVTPDFPTRSVEITGSLLRFRSDPATVQEKVGRIDRWLERANQKDAAMANRSEEQRRHREDLAREAQEMTQWNERWSKL
jgi:hypothetical protein